ncbi:glycosyltransferase family 2 protein [Pontivivens ytuae]|uniref:Glycosyltransferase family 2 protein n=1 Tax=Pontivivens ytuae TaxID=2789856 RepID=A0A7S9LVH9_9RHOB|nr:glycosyltransferase family 2 protein [Pontivivens ytuae]QPH55933.1 glycosyltransferase family 2 protein [Pontivivens ytuae]
MTAPIVSYWTGGPLDYIAWASLVSAVRAGHRVTLWAHFPVPEVPEGVTLADANRVVDWSGTARANRSVVASRMRWELLSAFPGAVFMTPTELLLHPLEPDADGYLFGWEGPDHVGVDVVALAADSAELETLRRAAADPTPIPPWAPDELRTVLEAAAAEGDAVPAGQLPWGMFGATALTRVLQDSGAIARTRPAETFHPLPYAERSKLLERRRKIAELTTDQSVALPLFRAETLRAVNAGLAGLPRYWCPLGEALRKMDVNPRDRLPRGVRLHPKDDRWEPADAPLKPVAPVSVAEAAPAVEAEEPRTTIITCMKNEGPFILEWVAHHRAIGVTDFIVYTNDCTDGTVEMLDLLAEKGIITARYDNPWRNSTDNKAGDPQRAALWHAQTLPVMQDIDWIMPMDVDEYLTIHVGEGLLADLRAARPDADMVSVLWRLFGNDGQRCFEDGFVTERMRRAAPENCKKPFQAWGFKTLFRNDGAWGKFSVHRPRNIAEERSESLVWISGSGARMPPDYFKSGWRALRDQAGYALASLNHYAVRDAESYLVKRERGRVNHIDQDQGLAYWLRMNHNLVEDRAIDARLPATRAEYDRLLSDPEIAAQHEACVAAHKAKIAELHGRTDMAALYAAITAPLMEKLSRLTPHFGNRVFDAGPQALPQDVLDWVDAWDGTEPLPGELSDPVPLPPEEADADRLLPKGSDLRFPEMPRERPVQAPVVPEEQQTVEEEPEPEPQPAGRAPSGDPIWLGEADDRAFASLLARTQPRYPPLAPVASPLPSDNIVVVTAMRNEAPFILEWIAWHLVAGVRHFLVYSNDCTDPTPQILDRLAELGLVTHLENPFNRASGQKPQRGALNDAWTQPVVQESDWYLVVDCDEFVNVHVGDNTLQGLIAAMNHPDIVSMTWRLFGNHGIAAYEDRPVTEQFVRCAPQYLPRPRLGWGFKSMTRPSAPSNKIGVHRPLDLDPDAELRWVNGSGRRMPEKSMGNSTWFSRKASIGYDMVTLNHYMLRSAESFLVKRERGRINHVDQDQGLDYWRFRNYATETDTRAAEFMRRCVAPELAKLKGDPVLGRLHDEAVAWHKTRIAHLRSLSDYATLYEAITDPDLKDAVYVAEALEELGDG